MGECFLTQDFLGEVDIYLRSHKAASYAFISVQSPSVAWGCWFVTCLARGSTCLGHSHSSGLRRTGKLINTQPPYKGLVLGSLVKPHICLCLEPRSHLHLRTPGKNYSQHVWRNAPSLTPIPGYQGHQYRKNTGFDIKAEQRSWIVQCWDVFFFLGGHLNQKLNMLFASVVGTFDRESMITRWPLFECMTHFCIKSVILLSTCK